MVDNLNPTNQFHPYQPPDAIPQTGSGSGFIGSIDEVAIYDKALSQARIRAHFAARRQREGQQGFRVESRLPRRPGAAQRGRMAGKGMTNE